MHNYLLNNLHKPISPWIFVGPVQSNSIMWWIEISNCLTIEVTLPRQNCEPQNMVWGSVLLRKNACVA